MIYIPLVFPMVWSNGGPIELVWLPPLLQVKDPVPCVTQEQKSVSKSQAPEIQKHLQ
jgi:hypothetical protein